MDSSQWLKIHLHIITLNNSGLSGAGLLSIWHMWNEIQIPDLSNLPHTKRLCSKFKHFQQNHCIIEFGGDLWRSFGQASSSEHGQLQILIQHWKRVVKALSSWVVKISRDGEPTAVLASLFHCSATADGDNCLLTQCHCILGPVALLLRTPEKRYAASQRALSSP